MGLQFKELVVKQEISLKDLQDKVLAIDSMNILYQFLTTIRAADGSMLTDSHGNVTSHLIGLFSRTTAFMEAGLKLIFVFDGEPPAIKKRTWEKRTAVKQEAAKLFRRAELAGDEVQMKKYAARMSVLTKDMASDAKAVIRALGLPIVDAPSEGEAQTAYMVKKGDAYASVSQDYDNLIFGCPRLARNFSIAGKKKKTGTLGYQTVQPELIVLKDVLKHLNITLEQLIALAILIGTDYNPGGIKGIGPKTALKLVKEHMVKGHKDAAALFRAAEWEKHFPDLSWQDVLDTIKNMPVTDEYALHWKKIDEKELWDLLVRKHDFEQERVKKKIEALKQLQRAGQQKGLKGFW